VGALLLYFFNNRVRACWGFGGGGWVVGVVYACAGKPHLTSSRPPHTHTTTPTQLLEKHGLTPSDFQKLVLRFQGEPRIAQALQHSQTQQAEALARMGMRV
jgi:hypothetical protein